jgi:methylated-DNA-[protein]-cysteine S-methyltransferase
VITVVPGIVGAAGDNVGVSSATVSELAWGALASPVGEISVACSAAGLARVRFGPPPFPPGPAGPAGDPPGPAGGHLDAAIAQVTEYFAGQRRAFDVQVDWPGMSPTQRQVLPVLLASAGYGETVTYGELARRAGLADGSTVPAARVAGQIMGSNPCAIIVPCHRVVASDGLGGYSGGTGIEAKRWLLIFEGALPPTLDWDASGPPGPGIG